MEEEKKKVFLITANSVIKKVLIEGLAYNPEIELCGTSESTILPAEEFLFSVPDFVLLDIALYEEEKGLIRNILDEFPNIVVFILCDFYIPNEVQLTTRALCLGVADFIQKPFDLEPSEIEKFKNASIQKLLKWPRKSNSISNQRHQESFKVFNKYEIIVIHCSTGGLHALIQILPPIPKDFPLPILVNIQLPKVFSKTFLERLNQLCNLYVKEIRVPEVLTPSTVYLFFGKPNIKILNSGNKKTISISEEDTPSQLFSTIAESFPSKAIGVILTGNEVDLTQEIRVFKEKGGLIILQDETTSINWNTAKRIYESQSFDIILPLEEITDKLCQLAWV